MMKGKHLVLQSRCFGPCCGKDRRYWNLKTRHDLGSRELVSRDYLKAVGRQVLKPCHGLPGRWRDLVVAMGGYQRTLEGSYQD